MKKKPKGVRMWAVWSDYDDEYAQSSTDRGTLVKWIAPRDRIPSPYKIVPGRFIPDQKKARKK